MSGEDFVEHSIAVASILVGLLVDSTSICAALLHDVVEDSDVTADDIAREFGSEVAELVDGLTKIAHLTFRSSVEEQSENYRKLLLSVARDARVIIIKLADRLHNMRTLEHLAPERRHRIATETRELYAPLANRFGMANVKAELEDLAFKFLEPEEYQTLAQQVAAKRAAREEMIERLRVPLEQELQRAGIPHFEVSGRPKHLWSIYQKMRKRNKPFDEIYDLMAMRVIVPIGARVLSRPRPDPPRLDAAAGADQGLHRQPQVQRLPVAAHHDLRSRRPALRDPDPHPRDAPHRRVRHRGALALQDRRRRHDSSATSSAGSASCSSCSRRVTRPRSSSSSSRSTSITTRSSSSRRRAT